MGYSDVSSVECGGVVVTEVKAFDQNWSEAESKERSGTCRFMLLQKI